MHQTKPREEACCLWYVRCCAVLCCAVLCCAVLCCAVLCCAEPPSPHHTHRHRLALRVDPAYASARPSAESCGVIPTEAKRIVLAKKVCCAHIVLNRSDWLGGADGMHRGDGWMDDWAHKGVSQVLAHGCTVCSVASIQCSSHCASGLHH